MMWQDWQEIAACSQVIMMIGVGAWGYLRWRLGRGLTPLKEHRELMARVAAMETRLSALPTHDDIRSMVSRLSGVESKLAATDATLGGIKDNMKGVEHQLGLIMTHLLEQK